MTVGADPSIVRDYVEAGYWGTTTLSQVIEGHAREKPGAPAIISGDQRLTWAEYDAWSDRVAGALAFAGLEPGACVAVLLQDGPGVHVAMVGAEKAGLVVAGIGPRAAQREIEHLVDKAEATAILTEQVHRGQDMTELVAGLRNGRDLSRHIVIGPTPEADIEVDGVVVPPADPGELEALVERRRLGPDDLFLLNSTSGTTGLPKCVMHTQNRWFYFHKLASRAGALNSDDVFLGLIPAPFGFGIWTSHFTPALLGAPVVVMPRFDAAESLGLIERERVSVVAAVSTQFIMMLNAPEWDTADMSSLRAMFTGGEAVPYDRAARFEETTGSRVLQFFGSNETGALSYTSVEDTREKRLRTAGRVIDDMNVRLFDEGGGDVTASGGPGQPGCRGPATCLGYYRDDEANRELVNSEGWMMTGDIAVIDDEGYLSVVGRKSDFIIRGGKNVSAPAVEEELLTHPDVRLAAAVAMPDETFGERVCAYVVLASAASSLDLEQLTDHLASRHVSKEMWPERLIVVDELPRSSGGKVAKGELREDIRRRLAEEN